MESEFDLKAQQWDNNPVHWDRSVAVADHIRELIPLKKEMVALEFGAGTGIASFLLKDYLKEITMMDSSTEMVKVMNEKIKKTGVKNLKALNFNLEESDYTETSFDFIFTQMALHHVSDIGNILRKFHDLLFPGGYLAIADLYPEDGSFHGEGFTGHKGLLGPPGVGGLVLGDRLNAGELEPLVRGGTGSRSESDIQPEDLPDKFESGTLNGVGIAGLGAGVRILNEQGIEGIRAREIGLTRVLIEGLKEIPGVTVYGPVDLRGRTAVVSITVAGRRVSDIGMQLDEQFGILCRVGLHCAPAAHRTIGTLPEGTVRLAPGFSSKEHDIHAALRALKRIVAKSP